MNRNFEKSHRTMLLVLVPGQIWARIRYHAWANSGLDSTFGNVETEFFWVMTRGAFMFFKKANGQYLSTKFSTCIRVRTAASGTGYVRNRRKRVRNRDHHPIFGTTVPTWPRVTNPSISTGASFGAIFRQSWSLLLWQTWNLQRLPGLTSGFYPTFSTY